MQTQIKVQSLNPDTVLSASNSMYPCELKFLSSRQFMTPTSSYYGFVTKGTLKVQLGNSTTYHLSEGTFFGFPGPLHFEGDGEGFIIERFGYRCLPLCGGPLESSGRLCYIDNCSASILLGPARLGDPVLNHLSFPAQINQTMHIHPSTRLGFVVSGSGFCNLSKDHQISLNPGMVFIIPERVPHSFTSLTEGLQIIAFHPESDTGPTDEDHPMKSRTYLRY